jgi:hypothetical protein
MARAVNRTGGVRYLAVSSLAPLFHLIGVCIVMDLLVFAAGAFLFSRKHRFLGCLLMFMGVCYFFLAFFASWIAHA